MQEEGCLFVRYVFNNVVNKVLYYSDIVKQF